MTPGDSQYNVLIGHNAGKYANEGSCCSVYIGADAGCKKCGTTSNCSVAVGAGAMKNHCNSWENVAIGYQALAGSNSTAVSNIGIGVFAGRCITSAQSNVLIGNGAGDSLTSGGGNVFIGKEAGQCGTTDLKFNVFIGCSAGYNQTAGEQNVLLGCRITAPITDGSHQMGIGNETSYNTGVSKYWIMGNSNYNVGIGTTNPEPAVGVGNTAKLSVGIVSAYQLYGEVSGQINLNGMSKEKINIVANKLSAATDIDLEDGLVHYFSTTETADATPNIRFNSSTTLNSKLSVGDSITVTIISSTNNTNYSYEQLTIDGSAVTEQWIGGAPPSGGSSGYDTYTYQIIKTADATYLVFGNKVNFT